MPVRVVPSASFATLTCLALLPTAIALWGMDLVRTATRTDEAIAKYGVTGKGVTVAIVDRGIDWRHPDFIKPDGTTRIKWLLDMSGQNGTCPGNPAPIEYSEQQINAALAGGAAIPTDDFVGHGTVTAGLAAGNGRAFASGKYRGMAPDADLIIVKAAGGAPAHGSVPAESPFLACFDDALSYVSSKAALLHQPVVTTFNFGTQYGPIDGTSDFSRKVDLAFGLDNPGRIFVAPPGDEGNLPDHAGGTYSNGDTIVKISKSVDGSDGATLWYSGSVPLHVTIKLADGTVVGNGPGESMTQKSTAIYLSDYWQSTSGDGVVTLSVAGPPITGEIHLSAFGGGQGRFDLYGDFTSFTFLDHLVPGRLTDEASTKSAIVPSVIVNRTSIVDLEGVNIPTVSDGEKVGTLWFNSPGGPTRDGRLGVDIAVPGQAVFAAYGQNSFWRTLPWTLIKDGGGWYGGGGGGSGAGPVMTGAVALMLQLYPALTARQIKQILHDTAVSDSTTGQTPNPDWGYGKLDMVRTLDAVAALKAQSVPNITSVVNAGNLSPGIQNNSWITVYGTNLSPASARAWQNSDFVNGLLPLRLDGVGLTVNGFPAAISYISPGQVNAIAPADSTLGPVNVVVTNGNGSSLPFQASLQASAPAFFTFGPNNRYVAATLADGTYLAPPATFGPSAISKSARVGDLIVLYGTGFGPTNPSVPFGIESISPSPLAGLVSIKITGISTTPQYAGVTAVGEYQFNVVVPDGVPSGDQPIIASLNGRQTQSGLFVSITN